MNDDDLRRDLRDLARSYGDADRLRREVRWRLDSLDAEGRVVLPPPPQSAASWTRRLVLVAAVTCCLVAIGGLVLVESQGPADRFATESTSSSVGTTIARPSTSDGPNRTERFESTMSSPSVGFELPNVPVVELVSEMSDSVEFVVDGSGGEAGRLVVALPPVEDVGSVSDAIGWLESSPLSDIESVEDQLVGNSMTTRVRLNAVESMAVVGFRFGPRTFISASGVDRRYEAWLAPRSDGGVVIVWVDAGSTGIGAAVAVAEVVLASLDTGS